MIVYVLNPYRWSILPVEVAFDICLHASTVVAVVVAAFFTSQNEGIR